MVFMMASCHRTYTGIYWLRDARTIRVQEVDQAIYDAIQDLGFRREEPGLISKSVTDPPAHGRRLEGDEAGVDVTVSGGPLAITVRDYSNRQETEFTRELKRRIELCLREQFGLTDVKLSRQSEFVPN